MERNYAKTPEKKNLQSFKSPLTLRPPMGYEKVFCDLTLYKKKYSIATHGKKGRKEAYVQKNHKSHYIPLHTKFQILSCLKRRQEKKTLRLQQQATTFYDPPHTSFFPLKNNKPLTIADRWIFEI